MRLSVKRWLVAGVTVALFAAVPSPAIADWLTYHADLARTGTDVSVPAMTNDINQRWLSPSLDGDVFAEPLVFGNIVVSATEGNSIYAIDARTGNLLWNKNYGRPVPSSQLPCGNINPVGITGTPVIDAATGTLYAVTFVWDGSTTGSIHYVLEAINLNNSGAELWHRTIAPTDPTYTFDPLIEGQRSALSFASGTVYIPFGGRYGDCGNYRSWTVGAAATGATGAIVSYPLQTPNGGGGTWASSGGAMDSSNNLYISTGNTFCNPGCAFDYGNSVLKLSPNLSLLDYFAPSNWAALNAGDTDLGSVGPTLIGNSLLFQVGKEGIGYLLSTSSLGGTNHQTPLFSARVCNATADAAFGGVAYSAPYLYVPCSDRLEALLVSSGPTPSFTSAWHGPAGSIGPPIVAGGFVWSVDWNGTTLYALSPSNGAQRLAATLPNAPMHFATPAAGDGQVFVPDWRQIVAFGSGCGTASTNQYTLTDSDGGTWVDMDATNLVQTLRPTSSGWALLEANADLWTATAGYNQDIGIFVSDNAGADTLAGWKESGGSGGTFSPNAAFLQVAYPVTGGHVYVVKLKWKTNKPATGVTIYSGAGPFSPFSPTSLAARLIATTGLATAVTTAQDRLTGNDGVTWAPLDGGIGTTLTITPSANATALLGGNSDLWTGDAGYNQDLGIFVSVNSGPDQLLAWKESGGFNGTFSPNAAFVHAVYPMTGSSTYVFRLKWKANRNDTAPLGIASGAGVGTFSPTRLTAELVPSGMALSSGAIATQPLLTNSDGATWQPIDPSLDRSLTPTASSTVNVMANADLWTKNSGFNQDLGIFVSVGGGPDQLLAWKESGGFNGTFSPNAAFSQDQYAVSAGTNYVFKVKWKTNRPSPGGTIVIGAGPGAPFSPTRLTVETIIC